MRLGTYKYKSKRPRIRATDGATVKGILNIVLVLKTGMRVYHFGTNIRQLGLCVSVYETYRFEFIGQPKSADLAD